jgi:hypothetical protein
MKITFHLPDELMQRAKEAAQESGMTLAGFIKTALREALAKRQAQKPEREFKITTYGSGGLLPGVNLDNSADLQDIMEPPDELRKKYLG